MRLVSCASACLALAGGAWAARLRKCDAFEVSEGAKTPQIAVQAGTDTASVVITRLQQLATNNVDVYARDLLDAQNPGGFFLCSKRLYEAGQCEKAGLFNVAGPLEANEVLEPLSKYRYVVPESGVYCVVAWSATSKGAGSVRVTQTGSGYSLDSLAELAILKCVVLPLCVLVSAIAVRKSQREGPNRMLHHWKFATGGALFYNLLRYALYFVSNGGYLPANQFLRRFLEALLYNISTFGAIVVLAAAFQMSCGPTASGAICPTDNKLAHSFFGVFLFFILPTPQFSITESVSFRSLAFMSLGVHFIQKFNKQCKTTLSTANGKNSTLLVKLNQFRKFTVVLSSAFLLLSLLQTVVLLFRGEFIYKVLNLAKVHKLAIQEQCFMNTSILRFLVLKELYLPLLGLGNLFILSGAQTSEEVAKDTVLKELE